MLAFTAARTSNTPHALSMFQQRYSTTKPIRHITTRMKEKESKKQWSADGVYSSEKSANLPVYTGSYKRIQNPSKCIHN
jgi:hypothetical protein